MTRPMTPKQILVAKIAAEQKLDPKKLERLNMEELQKMDLVVPDEGDLLGSPELPSGRDSGSDETPVLPSSVGSASTEGTIVLGETVPEAGADIAPSETPIPPTQMETQEGQTDASGSIPSGERADAVVIGYHPVTGEPVYSDAQ